MESYFLFKLESRLILFSSNIFIVNYLPHTLNLKILAEAPRQRDPQKRGRGVNFRNLSKAFQLIPYALFSKQSEHIIIKKRKI